MMQVGCVGRHLCIYRKFTAFVKLSTKQMCSQTREFGRLRDLPFWCYFRLNIQRNPPREDCL